MSVTLGESLTISGRPVARRQAPVTEASAAASLPKIMPPRSTLGQETFSSIAATPSAPSSFSQTSTYSASVSPKTLAITAVS